MAEFIMNVDKSNDTESSYSYCKYAFSQKAIQTFYKGMTEGSKAVGVEHEDETYCLNMNWDYYTERNTEKYDYTNGRYNIGEYLKYRSITKWDEVIAETVPAHVNEGTTHYCHHDAADYPVYMPKATSGLTCTFYPTSSDSNVYSASSICMNRNRDLNGDGVIDQKELRWYLPTSSMYMQIAVAQSELPDPIIRFTDYPEDYFVANWNLSKCDAADRDGTYNFHFITSDYQYFWAEQCVTTGDSPWGPYGKEKGAAFAARCVRNLGTNPADEPQNSATAGSEVDNAFSYDSATYTFTQDNFSDNMLRGYSLGALAPHSVASPTSRPYKKFQVAKSILKNVSDAYVTVGSDGGVSFRKDPNAGSDEASYKVLIPEWTNSLNANGLCGQYYEATDKSDLGTWRIPNSSEICLMWIEGLLQGQGYYLSCSHEYFINYAVRNYESDNKTYLAYIDYSDRKVLGMDIFGYWNKYYHSLKLRCVRDVK
jgi:hypothetical protein